MSQFRKISFRNVYFRRCDWDGGIHRMNLLQISLIFPCFKQFHASSVDCIFSFSEILLCFMLESFWGVSVGYKLSEAISPPLSALKFDKYYDESRTRKQKSRQFFHDIQLHVGNFRWLAYLGLWYFQRF